MQRYGSDIAELSALSGKKKVGTRLELRAIDFCYEGVFPVGEISNLNGL